MPITSFVSPQASDRVVWSNVRKHNSRLRGQSSFGIRPFFTREGFNMSGRSVWKHSGYRRNAMEINEPKAKKAGLRYILKKRNQNTNKPKSSTDRVTIQNGEAAWVRRQLKKEGNYKMYRADLTESALRKVFKLKQVKRHRKAYEAKMKKIQGRNQQNNNAQASGDSGADMALVD